MPSPDDLSLRRWLVRCAAVLGCVCFLNVPVAMAGEHGGGGGPAPMSFVVNIGNIGPGGMMLQMSLVVEPATPEAGKLIDSFKPMIQHRVIIVAAGLSPEQLRKAETRDELANKLVEELNTDLGTSKKDGVKEVFFTAFIYQPL